MDAGSGTAWVVAENETMLRSALRRELEVADSAVDAGQRQRADAVDGQLVAACVVLERGDGGQREGDRDAVVGGGEDRHGGGRQ